MGYRKTHARHRDVAFDYDFPACRQVYARFHNSPLKPKVTDDPARVTCMACKREVDAGRTRLPSIVGGSRGRGER
jgi:hypothetical protein